MRACGSEEQGAAGHRGAALRGKERAANPRPASGFYRTRVACGASGYSQRSLPTAYRSKSILGGGEVDNPYITIVGIEVIFYKKQFTALSTAWFGYRKLIKLSKSCYEVP